MAGQRQPHRKMAADGARAENANPHGVISSERLSIVSASFHKLAPGATGACDLRRWHGAR